MSADPKPKKIASVFNRNRAMAFANTYRPITPNFLEL
jgi:hypothetical protein